MSLYFLFYFFVFYFFSPSLLFCCCCCFSFLVFCLCSFFIIRYHLIAEWTVYFFLERQPWERLDWKTVACCYCIPHKTTHPSWACFCFVFSWEPWEPLHKMTNDLCIYRARIGCFYNRTVNNHDKVFFLVNYQWSHFIFYAAWETIIEWR